MKNDGGPAFPGNRSSILYPESAGKSPVDAIPLDKLVERIERQGGMSLRDYFAGQALVAEINLHAKILVARITAGQKFSNTDDDIPGTELCARNAYLFADAMLTAREATPEQEKPDV